MDRQEPITLKLFIMSGFTAPVKGGGDSKKLETEKIPTGMQLCTFYGISDIGTQEGGNFGPKHKVGLSFEFPMHQRVFYEGDEAKPCVIYTEMTLSMHEKAGLRKDYVNLMLGKTLNDAEAEVFDLASLLGKHYIATINHSSCGKYANIASITPLNTENMGLFGLQQPVVAQINSTYLFYMSQSFASENYKGLPQFIRNKIKNSEEGKAHALAGGVFNDPPKNSGNGNNTSAAAAGPKIVMNPNSQYKYQDLKDAGWTDQQIVDGGHGSYMQAAPPPVPNASTPAAPSTPVTPVQAAAAPVAPAPSPVAPPPVPQKVLVMKDPNADINAYRKQGWTDEQLIEHGLASFQ